MNLLGLIGKSLTHSFSEKYFSEKFAREKILDFEYQLFPLNNIEDLPELIAQNPLLIGLNVTIPYKESVLEYIDLLDSVAGKIEAVNTIKIIREGNSFTLHGFNTDYFGFMESLKNFIGNTQCTALILGAGGASKAAQFVLLELGIPFQLVTRHSEDGHLGYSDLNQELISENRLIINTTPLGTFPSIEEFPAIPYEFLSKDHFLFDMIYNPAESKFLSLGKAKGANIKNGLEMLEIQAEEAFKIFSL